MFSDMQHLFSLVARVFQEGIISAISEQQSSPGAELKSIMDCGFASDPQRNVPDVGPRLNDAASVEPSSGAAAPQQAKVPTQEEQSAQPNTNTSDALVPSTLPGYRGEIALSSADQDE